MSPKQVKIKKELTNWYDYAQEFTPKYKNPSFNQVGIKHPFRLCLTSQSGGGKTLLALEILNRMAKTFGHVIVCVQNKSEPLYELLASKLKDDEITFYEGIENFPHINDIHEKYKKKQVLMIIDDLVNEKQDKIVPYFIFGRKRCKGISLMYLTQNFYSVPKIIRNQMNFLIFKKLNSTKDLLLCLQEFNLGVEKKDLMEIYKYATDTFFNFLMVDIDSPVENRFRKGFHEIITINS